MTLTTDAVIAFLLGPAGVTFLTFFIIWAGYKKLWVFGWYAQELKTRNERLENRLDKVSGAAQSATTIAEHVTTTALEKTEVTK